MLSPNTGNYLYGKGRLYFEDADSSGLLDLGNIPKFTLQPEVTTEDHYSSRSGTKLKDMSVVTESKVTGEFDIEEYSAENLNLAFLGNGVDSSSQSASFVSGASKTVVLDRFIDLGKMSLSTVKLTHGTVTSGPFAIGDAITGGTSSATGVVGWVDTGFIELYHVHGTFTDTETITSSGKSATLTDATVQEDIIVTDAASNPTTRYVLGEDYSLDVDGGLLRALTDGDITTTCYVSYDYAALTLQSVNALANTSISGKFVFIGDPDTGPRVKVEIWSGKVTVGGAAGFISDSITPIPMRIEVLADTANHPTCPFFKPTIIS